MGKPLPDRERWRQQPDSEVAEAQCLRRTWTNLYAEILPGLARARDPVQPVWPVTLDHCFARIILDNTVGEGQEPWDIRLKRPAVGNMSHAQLKRAIGLAERIRDGTEDLVALDWQSLEVRGKSDKKHGGTLQPLQRNSHGKKESVLPGDAATLKRLPKRKIAGQNDEDASMPSSKKLKSSKKQSTLSFPLVHSQPDNLLSLPASGDEGTDLSPTISKINGHTTLTAYRKRLYAALLSVPRGRYTTYAALSKFLGSSARAVGSGMRHNPFAPDVPCHRVLASDGSIGGFCGTWGVDGKHASKKVELLKNEGVTFDSTGKVRGPPFVDFVNLVVGEK